MFGLEYREWYCKYSMSLVIFKSPLSEIILIFCLRTWDMMYICINMKKYLVCQTIDYMQMSYDYENKELSIPFWSAYLSSPLKYFMGVWSFVIVYFQQNKKFIEMYESLTTFILHFVLILICGYINNHILEYYLPLKVLFCY